MRRSSIDEIYGEYERIIRIAASKSGSLCIGKALAGNGRYSPVVGWLTAEHAYFSDTILLWARFDDFRYAAFCSLCATLVCEALSVSIPLRGAISVGEAILDKPTNVFIGRAIVEAHDVEKAQAWLEVSFAASAAGRIQYFDPRLVLPYARHRKEKEQPLIQGVVLDWPRTWRENYEGDLLSELNSLQDRLGRHPYIDAAIDFARYSREKHDWFLTCSAVDTSES